uniref:G-protein coupled receptors family 1 profile domain-containing protein n=1 Tax=Acrobeloides nanus TaxID=290746 RepID=A0A914DZV3_9BILA
MNATIEFLNATNEFNNATNESLSYDEHLTLPEQIFYLVNGSLGSIFNVIVLFIALLHADTYDKPRQIIVINMTFADLMTCLIYMLTRPYLGQFYGALCYPYYVAIFTSQLCSCVNLLWLNVDKLIFIKFPLHYYTIVSRKKILIVTVATWSSLILLGLIMYCFMTVKRACNYVILSPLIYLPICVVYIVIITICFVISSIIYLIARNSRRMEPGARSKLFQRLFFVFSSTLWTFITCLPYRLVYLINGIWPPSNPPSNSDLLFMQLGNAFYFFLVVGIVINPIITIVTQRLYRNCLLIYLRKACICLQYNHLRGVVQTRLSFDVDGNAPRVSVSIARSSMNKSEDLETSKLANF